MAPTKHPGGRPTKLDAKRTSRILQAIKAGNGARVAAALAGLSETTFFEWQSSNPEFAERIRAARAEAENRRVRLVERASRKTWKAAAWMLERQNPGDWGPRVVLMVREAFTVALARLEAELDAATFERVASILAGLDSTGEPGEAQGGHSDGGPSSR